MRRPRFALLFLAMPAIGGILGACRGAEEEPPERVVRGTLLDAASREPVAGARVRVFPRSGGGTPEGRTDAQGRFEVPLGPRGTLFLLEATAPGYGPSTVDGVDSSGADAEVGAILLHVAASLAGTVRSEEGAPLGGAQVFVSTGLPGLAEREGRTPLATTSADGAFEVRSLPAGTVRVGLRAEGRSDTVLERIGLAPGETTSVEAALRPEIAVEGVTLDDLGAILAGARVAPHGGPEFPRAEGALSDASGRFRLIGLAAAPRAIRASAPGFPPKIFEPPPPSGRLALERGRMVTLRAERSGGDGAPTIAGVRYEVHTRTDQGWRRVEGTVAAEEREALSPSRWRFAMPRGGEARIVVTADDGSSARAESKSNSQEEEIAVPFESPLTVRGRVEGPAELAGSSVQLTWGGPGEERYRRALTGAEGSFSFERVPAGGGRLGLLSPVAYAEPVLVPPSAAEVTIRAVEASRIRGRLTHGGEPPGEVVPIRAFLRTGRRPAYRWDLVAEGATGPEGEFEIGPLSRGLFALAPKRPASARDGGIRRLDEEWPRVEFEAPPLVVRVGEKEEVRFDLALPRMRPTGLEVSVAVNGNASPGSRVDLVGAGGEFVGAATTDEGGVARFRLERGGSFQLRIVGAGFRESKSIEVGDGTAERIDLQYACGGASGVLLGPGGRGLALRVDLERVVDGAEDVSPEERICAAVLADAEGKFAFRDVVPGIYQAVAYDPSQGHATVGVGPFEVRAGEETQLPATAVPEEAPLRITLRSATGKFPFASAKIRAAPGEPPLPRPVVAWIPAGDALVRSLAPRRLVVELVLYGPWRADATEREVALSSDGTEISVAFEVEKTE